LDICISSQTRQRFCIVVAARQIFAILQGYATNDPAQRPAAKTVRYRIFRANVAFALRIKRAKAGFLCVIDLLPTEWAGFVAGFMQLLQ
jgi:hypothetical protein